MLWSGLFFCNLVHHFTGIFFFTLSCSGTVSCHVTFSITLEATSRGARSYSRTSFSWTLSRDVTFISTFKAASPAAMAVAWIVIVGFECWLGSLHLLVLNFPMPLISIRLLYLLLRELGLLPFSEREVLLPKVNRIVHDRLCNSSSLGFGHLWLCQFFFLLPKRGIFSLLVLCAGLCCCFRCCRLPGSTTKYY